MPITTVCPACGKQLSLPPSRLLREQTFPPCCSRSCAATIRNPPRLTHGHCTNGEWSKEFRAWYNMRTRCYFPSHQRYDRYGGRGITVCEHWRNSFENFLADVGPAPSQNHTLGRINNDGHYEPKNVEWQTGIQQANNTGGNRILTAFGRTQTLQQWCDELNINYGTVLSRLDRYGWTIERALSTPRLFKGHEYAKRLLAYNGQEMSIADWSRQTGIPAGTILRRISVFEWTVEKALTIDQREYHGRP